jgi:hypothetical protein
MDLLREQEDYEIRWKKRTVEQLQERRSQGERYVEMPIEEVQQLLLQNIGLLQRLNYVEKTLLVYAERWTFPAIQVIKETK